MALKIYNDTIQLMRDVQKVLVEIARRDADLARQMKRALTSVALNISEGEHRRDGNGRARFSTAMGSANEVRASLEVAEALGYIETRAQERDTLDRIARTLFVLTR